VPAGSAACRPDRRPRERPRPVRHRTWLLALALVVGALASCGQSQDSKPERSRLPAEFYGVAGHVLRLWSAEGRTSLVDRHLARISELGLSFVRANLDWTTLEPAAPVNGQHRYDFRSHDEWVAALAQRGLRWYAVGVSPPAWAADPAALAAGCGIRSGPARPDDLAALMGTIATRYGRDGSFWAEHPELPYRPVIDYEVWNEPNHGGAWCPLPEPHEYAPLYLATRDAIRAVDPNARVLVGGLAPYRSSRAATALEPAATGAAEFVEAMTAADPRLSEEVDAVGIHLYGEPETIVADLGWYRDLLDGSGLEGVPLSVNEIGWTTRGEGGFTPVPESVRATRLGQAADQIARSSCGIVSLAPHTWVTEEADPANQEHWFGLADPETARPYPSAEAYAEVVEEVPAGRRPDQGTMVPLCG
jgi:hypothetical protein